MLIRYLHSWRCQGHDTMVCKSLHEKKFCQNTNLALSLLNYHPLIPRQVICHFGLKFCRYSSTKSSLFSFSEWRCWMSKAAAITDAISNGSLIKWFFKINYAALPWESFPSRFTENYFSVAPWDVWGLNYDIYIWSNWCCCVTLEHVFEVNKNTINFIERDNELFSVTVASDLNNRVTVKIQALISLTKIPLSPSTAWRSVQLSAVWSVAIQLVYTNVIFNLLTFSFSVSFNF